MGRSLQIFAQGMSLHKYVFSFLYNAVVSSKFKCEDPENQTNFFPESDILINQNKPSPTQDF